MTVNSSYSKSTQPHCLHSYTGSLANTTFTPSIIKRLSNNHPLSAHSRKAYAYALIYRLIFSNLNKIFEAELAYAPLDIHYEMEDDTTTPDMLSATILAAATNLFTPFLEHHPELDESPALDCFLNLVKEGISNGLAETKEKLDSKQLLEERIAWKIDLIDEQLHQGLDEYCQSFGYSLYDEAEAESDYELMLEADDLLDEALLDRLRS